MRRRHGKKGPEVMDKEIMVTFKEILLHVQIRNRGSGLRTRLKSRLYRRCFVVFKNTDSEEGKPRAKPGEEVIQMTHQLVDLRGGPRQLRLLTFSLPLEYLFSHQSRSRSHLQATASKV